MPRRLLRWRRDNRVRKETQIIASLQGEIGGFQVAVFFLAQQNAVEDDVPFVDAADQLMGILPSFGPQRSQASIEIPMRLENHPEILETAFKKEFVGRYPVEEDAIKDGALHTTLWEVFHQQR